MSKTIPLPPPRLLKDIAAWAADQPDGGVASTIEAVAAVLDVNPAELRDAMRTMPLYLGSRSLGRDWCDWITQRGSRCVRPASPAFGNWGPNTCTQHEASLRDVALGWIERLSRSSDMEELSGALKGAESRLGQSLVAGYTEDAVRAALVASWGADA